MAVSANVEDAHCSILQRILGVFPIVLAAQRSALTCIMWRDVHTTWLTVSWSSGQLLRSLRGVRIPKVFPLPLFPQFHSKTFLRKIFSLESLSVPIHSAAFLTRYRPGGGGETICPLPTTVRRWQKSWQIYVRLRTGPQSAYVWWQAVAKLQAASVPIA